MKMYRIVIPAYCALLSVGKAFAQKPFTEGTIVYHVELTSADNRLFKGTYIFSFKNGQIRKELRLDNGYSDVTLINANRNTIYSLQEGDGRKFAIQLSMDDMLNKQRKFKGYVLAGEAKQPQAMAGQNVYKGTVVYSDSSMTEILYSKDWRPEVPYTWNRFPDAQFVPLRFAYKEDNGISMVFTADKMELSPVVTSIFNVPKDYKMISYDEYKQLSK
ncbi:hypothetical protein [Nemorincola caseinilytica]